MEKLLKLTFIFLFAGMWALPSFGQCETWLNLPNKDAVENDHVLYRQFMKTKEYDKAFDYWQKVYKAAPAADGNRSSHYVDGRTIYLDKFKNETDEAKKAEYAKIILRLFDEHVECYPKEKALNLGLKVYEMFYTLRSPYADALKACEEAVEAGGDNTSYAVFVPYASIAVYDYKNGVMDAEQARKIYTTLNDIADKNIAKGGEMAPYYEQGKGAMNGVFAEIENDIFDCEFFKKKLEPDYRKDEEDIEMLKYIYNKLTAQGCDESDPFVAEIKHKYETVVAEINKGKLEEFYAANPGEHGVALFKEQKYTEALQKFKEGIRQEEAGDADPEKLANYYFYMASVEFRQLGKYNEARTHARKAASLKKGWGRPYMLIGDMYAKSSRSCGNDAFDAQLAILAAIDKYAYAKSIDQSVAREANKKIGSYAKHKPTQEDAFMRKVKEGQSIKVPCWIGETVKVRFQ
ncbi:MAG TPA: tetratricopeptide repeat protein [Bacteroidetes bacterium]|nr:tetratricopeptide repeat protein [Bacteroidota bacterium]